MTTTSHTSQHQGQHDKATLFHSLHHGAASPLLLANAWDVASALVVEEAGATAVATTSAGVAWSLGSPDGDALDRDRAVGLIARVAAAVKVPVTADIEGGFAETAEGVGETVAKVIEAGAVGVNLEDGTRDPAAQADRIAAARAAADKAGIPLYLNARIDMYLFGLGEESDRLAETIRRMRSYVAAGASGIFVPGTTDPETVAALVAAVDVPLNLLVGPGDPSVAELAKLGVARLSLGSSVASAAYGAARRATRELLERGTYDAVTDAVPYGELNALFPR
ncbi:isocitrate lyase/phosphoenolpyruvate mutase family protein [Streptomyces sp. NBC_00237]|uniref:isocitrate lyase/PEP mutase family protein n=1 Tax=Streptomyces sp. NBC_00237 TaxID=2975687 RepID=UPI002252741F|nr:isocitrate lyase/phosphoenolpyruvate mutase family protein [Streptomyces sp. NBC_00237]MCX5204459.1 isocitrate lyase/phosphoenolpyruvate mutase family protein [Streptomyces sp. NBC_00237]